jgi:lipopolysaccharide transport system ATP-binding protein
MTNKFVSLFKPAPATDESREDFWALKDVSFEIKEGEAVGIIGRNGAGKSTLLKLLSRITKPTTGRIELHGRVASLLEVGTGFHPELSGRENIYLNGAVLGMQRAEIKKKFDEIVAFADVEKFLDTPVKRYSSGMYMRLAFAVAAHLEPEILVVDEVLAVGDMEFQKKCLGKMEDVSKTGRTVLFVSHNMDAILRLCSRAILLQKGGVSSTGPVRDIVHQFTSTHASQPSTISLGHLPQAEHARRNVILLSAEWPKSTSSAPWTVPFGQSIGFSVKFECRKAIRHLELGIALNAASGTELASTSSIVSQPEVNLAPGIYSFNVTYTSLKLVPNNYSFGLGLRSDAGVEDHYAKAFSIDIVPSEASSRARTDTFWGYLVPDVTYELVRP